VLLRVEDLAPTVNIDASVGCLPLPIHKVDDDLGFAVMTLELDRLHQDLDGAHPQDSPSHTDVLVYQVGLYHGEREDIVEVGYSDHHDPLVSLVLDVEPSVV